MYKLIAVLFFLSCTFAFPQSWKSSGEETTEDEAETTLDLMLFHSTGAISLPTAETIQQGDFLYGISHRFNVPVSSGTKDLWGLDGGVTMRMELGYAFTDKLLATLGRSNRAGQWDFNVKYKALQFESETLPVLVSFAAGASYMGKPAPPVPDSRNAQFYVQGIVNTLIDKKLGIGIVPSYLHNAHPWCECETMYSFTMGAYAQYYINDLWSVVVESNNTMNGWRNKYDSYAFGAVMETGGHFFKFVFTNNILQNQAQFLAGAEHPMLGGDTQDIHFGFQITRNL